jgi:hypothetical protein
MLLAAAYWQVTGDAVKLDPTGIGAMHFHSPGSFYQNPSLNQGTNNISGLGQTIKVMSYG